MPVGVPLTPAQVETIVRVHTETGNVSEAARRGGCSEAAARECIRRLAGARRRDLHQRACERGLREGRKHLEGTGTFLAGLLEAESADGPGMEPRDVAAIANALTNATKARMDLAAVQRQNAQARLTREKTRAEIALIRARLAGTLPPDRVQVETMDDAAIERRIAELAVDLVAPGEIGPGGTPGSPGGAGTPEGEPG